MRDSNDHSEIANQTASNVTDDTPLEDDIPPTTKSDQHGCNDFKINELPKNNTMSISISPTVNINAGGDNLPATLENNIPKTPQVDPSLQFNETLFFKTANEGIDTLDAEEQKLLQNSVELLHLSKNPITNNRHHSPNRSSDLTENEHKFNSSIKPKNEHQTKRTYTEHNSTSPSNISP